MFCEASRYANWHEGKFSVLEVSDQVFQLFFCRKWKWGRSSVCSRGRLISEMDKNLVLALARLVGMGGEIVIYCRS